MLVAHILFPHGPTPSTPTITTVRWHGIGAGTGAGATDIMEASGAHGIPIGVGAGASILLGVIRSTAPTGGTTIISIMDGMGTIMVLITDPIMPLGLDQTTIGTDLRWFTHRELRKLLRVTRLRDVSET